MRRIDARAADRRNALPLPPVVDAGLRELSRRADRGVLWFTLAAVFAVFGRRRAATRGILTLIVSSVIANLIGKELFGGDRPLLDDVPISRRLVKPPTSPSFPSGHSASAAGFALGAAVDNPGTLVVTAPLAAGVAYSRLHTGSHWLSDVVGGLAIGATIAGLGRLVAPPPDHRAAGEPVSLPRLRRGRGLFLVVNPGSGTGALRIGYPAALRRALPEAVVHTLAPGENLSQVLTEGIRRHRPDVVGASGGDGTIGVAAGIALSTGLPLLVLPGGTLNHFARAAGVTSLRRAIRAARRGHGILADVATARIDDGAPFTVLNTASIGVYPELVAEREKLEGRIGKWPAALVAARRILPTVRPVHLDLSGREIRAWSAFIGVNRYYPRSIIPQHRRRLDDGTLDVRIARSDVSVSRSRMFASLALGGRISGWLQRLPSLSRMIGVEAFTARELDFTVDAAHDGLGFAHDGEVISPDDSYRVRLRIDDRRLRVYAPHRR